MNLNSNVEFVLLFGTINNIISLILAVVLNIGRSKKEIMSDFREEVQSLRVLNKQLKDEEHQTKLQYQRLLIDYKKLEGKYEEKTKVTTTCTT